jgi:pSer/pThr/pTyr-binding forkhead associated (FHA) protein
MHCRLVAISGGVIVLDEGSTNGTWVNGQRVRQPTLVGLEDTVVVGPYMLSVQSLVAERNLHPRRRGTQVEVDINKLRAEHRSGQQQ